MSKLGGDHVREMTQNYGITLPEGQLLAGDRIHIPVADNESVSLQNISPPATFQTNFATALAPGIEVLDSIRRAIAPEESRDEITNTDFFKGVYWDKFSYFMRPNNSITTGRLNGFSLQLLAPKEQVQSRGDLNLDSATQQLELSTLLTFEVRALLRSRAIGHLIRMYVKPQTPEATDGNSSIAYKRIRIPKMNEDEWHKKAAKTAATSNIPLPNYKA